MRVVHERTELAGTVEVADAIVSKIRGLMFRRSIPNGYALVFPFDEVKRRSVHMIFVFVAIDVIWVADERVEQVSRLRPWTGFGIARADTIIELPRGGASSVEVGDTVRIVPN